MEFNGLDDDEVNKKVEAAIEIAKSNGGSNFEWSSNEERRNFLWKARHQLYYACQSLRPNCKALTTDVCVPISKLTEMIVKTKEDIEKADLFGEQNFVFL